MISITNLQKSFGEQTLFTDVNINIAKNDKIGLIGRNGSGKSTFLAMIMDRDDVIDGSIEIPKSTIIKSLEQNLNFSEDTILRQVCTALPHDSVSEDWKAKSILMGLGFIESDFDKPASSFSSGFQVRVRLAEALVSESHLLLLDEPTNYLDILSLRWLERFLKSWKGAFILVTHDRHFMNEVVTHTIAIHREKMHRMKGGPQKLIEHIKSVEEIYEKTRKNQIKKQEKSQEFIRTFRAGARSAGLVQSRIKALEKQKIGEELTHISEINFRFHSVPFRGNFLLDANDISFGYDDQSPLIRNFSLSVRPKDRIAVIGRNGEGKSTLLRLLTEKLKSQSGKIQKYADLKIGYYGSDSKDELDAHRSIIEELFTLPVSSEQEVRNLCGSLLFSGDAVKKTISKISGGEKSRVCLGKVMLFASHILILDEPTNHLDMESCQALTKALKDYEGAVIFVTHDEDMISELANRLVLFEQGNISVRDQTYDEFLESGGWTEEEEVIVKKKKDISANKQKYLDNKAKNQRLRVVKNRQKALEKELAALDEEQKENSILLQKACSNKNVDKIRLLGIKAKEITDSIDQSYSEFEKLIDEEVELEQMQ